MSPIPRFTALVQRAAREYIPLDVSIELTNRCNHRCAHCYIPDFDAPDGISTDRILRLLDELAELGTLFLALTGGEPLLRREWPVIAHRARQLGFHVMLLTNGALIDEETADHIAELALQARISFHSADPSVFDRITGSPGSFNRVLAGVERLARRHAAVELTVPITALNRDAASTVPELARRLGVEYHVYTTLFAKKDGNATPLQLRLSAEEAVVLLERGSSLCVLPDEETGRIDRDEPLCAAGVRYAAISASGDVRACEILPGIAGNINHTSFREIWQNAPWFQRLRSITPRDLHVCSTCPKLDYCGRCHAQALVEDGDLLGPSRQACAYAQARERLARRHA